MRPGKSEKVKMTTSKGSNEAVKKRESENDDLKRVE
jgi:hypothetical protein